MTKDFNSSVVRSFSQAAKNYHSQAEIQRSVAFELMRRCKLSYRPKNILEIGCGTGFLTSLLSESFAEAKIDVVDVSPEMILCAKQHLAVADIDWYVGDAREHETDTSYDTVFSSSALQWMSPLHDLFKHVFSLMPAQAEFHFSIMLRGTLGELHQLRKLLTPHSLPSRELPTVAEIVEASCKAGFLSKFSEVEHFQTQYPNAMEFLRTLKKLGFTGGDLSRGSRVLRPGEISKLIGEYQSRYSLASGEVFASYRVAYFQVCKMAD